VLFLWGVGGGGGGGGKHLCCFVLGVEKNMFMYMCKQETCAFFLKSNSLLYNA